MTASASVVRTFRNVHLYLGVFAVPAILFFAFTGGLQTFSLHETTKGSSYVPAQWMVVLGQLHKKQTTEVPVRRAPPPSAVFKVVTTPPQAPARQAPNNLPMKIYFLVIALSLVISTVTGLYMSYKFTRNKTAIGATLAAGIVVPLLLLLV